MIRSLGIVKNFQNNIPQKQQISYNLRFDKEVTGPIRSIQKFVIILLTTVGSDPIRPWFGTYIGKLTQMNFQDTLELTHFIKEQCSRAISQFFQLQGDESSQNKQTKNDVISTIEITDIKIVNNSSIDITFLFTPLNMESIVFSIDFSK